MYADITLKLKYHRYMAEILTIGRKTIYIQSINQSINQIINQSNILHDLKKGIYLRLFVLDQVNALL